MKSFLAVLLTLALGCGLNAQTKRGLELADMFAMKRVASPALSPDGKWVAYNLTTRWARHAEPVRSVH